jgi:deoxyadenosine/deoxycytidine kinase
MLVSIEGNIGCGKSTLLRALSADVLASDFQGLRVSCELEPVEEWSRIFSKDGDRDISMLGEFYMDPVKNALAFQFYVLLTRQRQFTSIASSGSDLTLVERCLESDSEIFAKLNFSNDPVAWNAYSQWVTCVRSGLPADVASPTLIVYLRCSPKKCMERVRFRSRAGEGAVTLEYLQTLHDAHENWMSNLHKKGDQLILIIDSETDTLEDMMSNVVTFIRRALNNQQKNAHDGGQPTLMCDP